MTRAMNTPRGRWIAAIVVRGAYVKAIRTPRLSIARAWLRDQLALLELGTGVIRRFRRREWHTKPSSWAALAHGIPMPTAFFLRRIRREESMR